MTDFSLMINATYDRNLKKTNETLSYCTPEYVNNEIFNNTLILVWPRIPKTAGENLLNLLTKLTSYNYKDEPFPEFQSSAYHGERILEQNPVECWSSKLPDQATIETNMDKLINLTHLSHDLLHFPLIMQGHFIFIEEFVTNHNLYNSGTIKLISMIRHPLKRIISSYYYIRGESGGWRSKPAHKAQILQLYNATYNYSFDECVFDYMYGDNLCSFSSNYLVSWFCGNDVVVCNRSNLTQLSLNRAIYNIDKYFSYIGIVEYFEESMIWFLYKFPQFILRGHYSTQYEKVANYSYTLQNFNANFWKDYKLTNLWLKQHRTQKGYHSYSIPNQTVMDLLHKKNVLDIKLYEYVLNKFKLCILETPIFDIEY